MNKAFGFGVAATMVFGGAASAGVVLYDNPADFKTTAHVNQEFGDFAVYSTYLVADMTIPDLGGGGVTLTSLSAFFSVGGGNWNGINMARVHIFADAGGLPGGADNPAASLLVGFTYDVNTGLGTTVGLDVDVPAGNYWIGLTPVGDFAAFGQQFMFGGVNQANGAPDAYRNPGGAFNFPDGTEWGEMQTWATYTEINLLVEGVAIPAPGALALLGLAGLVTRRRRRR